MSKSCSASTIQKLFKTLSGLCIAAQLIMTSACGLKENKSARGFEDSYLEGQGQCLKPLPPEIESEITNLSNNAERVKTLFQNYYPYSIFFLGNNYPNSSTLAPSSPLYNSEAIIADFIKEIKGELKGYSNGRFFEWFAIGKIPAKIDSRALDFGEESFVSTTEAKIRGVKELAKRWRTDSCNLQALENNKKDDVKEFVILLQGECPRGRIFQNTPTGFASMCLQDILTEWSRLDGSNLYLKESVRGYFEKTCAKLGPSCWQDFLEAQRIDELYPFWEKIREQFNARYYKAFFNLQETQTKFKCTGHESGTVRMHLNVNLQNLSSDYQQKIMGDLSTFVTEKWSKASKFEISFRYFTRNAPRDAIKIEVEKGIVSHVASNDLKTIHLASDIMGKSKNRMTVLAHELGHVLGFPDCYINFYEREAHRTVYYLLDFTNLMCNSSATATIPNSYFDSLVSTKCE